MPNFFAAFSRQKAESEKQKAKERNLGSMLLSQFLAILARFRKNKLAIV
jgi:hypothetical protein